MNKGVISYDDQTGVFKKNVVWAIEVSVAITRGIIYGECSGEPVPDEEVKECPASKEHITDTKKNSLELELFGESVLADFVPLWDIPYLVASDAFVKRLEKSDLTGYRARPIVKVVINQASIPNPKLYYFDITGKGGRDLRRKVTGAPNLCPHCKKEVMVCTGCGFFNWPYCDKCDKPTLFNPEAPEYSHPNGFRLDASVTKERPAIIEAKAWDGSDFFRVNDAPYCNTKAKEWLEKNKTRPIRFHPALLNIEGVEDRFK